MITAGVLITSRGHPELLTATVVTLARLASDPKDVVFAVYVDADDIQTAIAATRLQGLVNLELLWGPRQPALGTAVNHLAQVLEDRGHRPAYFHVLNDDVLPQTLSWDLVPLQSHYGVSSWTILEHPGAGDYPVISRRWYEAAGKRLFTDHFPYWFDDRWLMEVEALVHGAPTPQLPINLYARKTGTQRFREFEFWFRYYQFLEPERIAQAEQILRAIDKPVSVLEGRTETLAAIKSLQEGELAEYLANTEKLVNRGEPDETYVRAKQAALDKMGAAAELVAAAE